MASRRLERLREQFREEISDLIRRELRDPGLDGVVSITTVEVDQDLRHARVYVSVLGSDEDRARAVAALQRAAGFIRHSLARRMAVRQIPELAFKPDVSIERGDRILGLLREIEREESSRSAESDVSAEDGGAASSDGPASDRPEGV